MSYLICKTIAATFLTIFTQWGTREILETKLFPILEEIRTCDEKEGGQVRWLTSTEGLWKNKWRFVFKFILCSIFYFFYLSPYEILKNIYCSC